MPEWTHCLQVCTTMNRLFRSVPIRAGLLLLSGTLLPAALPPAWAEMADQGTATPALVGGKGRVSPPAAAQARNEAETAEPVGAGDALQAEEEEGYTWEDSRAQVREATEWVARGIDSWFGDKPFEQGGRVSNGRIRMRLVWREHDRADAHVRFRVKLRLPNLEERADFFIGSENEKDLVRSRPDTLMDQKRVFRESKKDDETLFAGMRLRFFDHVSFHMGLRDLYKPYLKLRYEQEWTFAEKCRLFFQETPYWALNDGLGETTVLEFEHALTSDLSLRWLNSGTLSEEDDGLDWYSSIGLHRRFEGNRQLSGEFLLDGETGAPVAVADYGILMKWRQPVWREWLFGEVTAGHYWHREKPEADRESQWAFGLGLQMNF